MLPFQDGQHIVSLQYQPSELIPFTPDRKNSIVDVSCTDNYGRQFIVEMQMYWTDSFQNRVLLNAAKVYVKQLEKGGKYNNMHPVYVLSFLNDTFDPNPLSYYHNYKIVDIDNTTMQMNGMQFVFIELPKFQPANRAEKKLYNLWLTFLTQIKEGSSQVPPELLEEQVTIDALSCLERNSYTQAQLKAYDKYWDDICFERSICADFEAKGLAEGEEKKLREMVLIGNRNGLSVEQMQKYFNLDKEIITEILASNSDLTGIK
jgi:predicted transposase/invertase (TIGR01784 family)